MCSPISMRAQLTLYQPPAHAMQTAGRNHVRWIDSLGESYDLQSYWFVAKPVDNFQFNFISRNGNLALKLR
jgi:hypothetical protein